MHFFIDSEGDIDIGVKYCVELSRVDGVKYVTLAFPSKLLYKVFMDDLIYKFATDDTLPPCFDIEASIIITKDKYYE